MSIWGAFSSGVSGMSTNKSGGFFSDITAGGLLKTVGSIFGKTKPPTVIYNPRTGVPETPKSKSNMTMILVVGGVAVVGLITLIFLKK